MTKSSMQLPNTYDDHQRSTAYHVRGMAPTNLHVVLGKGALHCTCIWKVLFDLRMTLEGEFRRTWLLW
jgi:hypothetical protein